MTERPTGRKALVFIGITVLMDTVGFGIILPVLPALLMHITGQGVERAAIYGGWLAFAYALMQFVCAPILGGLSDHFGRRPVLLFAVGALGLDYIVQGLAPTLAWLFFGRIVAGIAGASFTPAYAYVADVSPPDKRAQNFGLIAAMFGVGFIAGPAIGGLLGGLGPRAPFFAAAALSLLNFIYGVFVLPESLPRERRRAFEWKRANPLGTLMQMRKRPAVLGLLGALFLWMVAHQVMPAVWSYYTKFRYGWNEAMIGVSLAIAGAVMALSQAVLVRPLVKQLGERRAALLSISIATVGYLGFASATRGWMIFAWQTTWLFSATVMPTTQGLMSHRVEPNAQGELQGAVASLFSLSSIVGPPLLSHLFGYFTSPAAPIQVPGAAFFASAVLAVLTLAIYWAVTRDAAVAPAAALAQQ
jgi:DHA1 family tetracycline resistance protein-like MFS transporter